MENTFNDALLALYPKLKTYCITLCNNRDDAEDLIQEVMVKALTKRHLFDGDKLGGWLYRIARNEFINTQTRLRPYSFSSVNLDDRYDAFSFQEHTIDSGLIESKLNRLGGNNRNTIMLRIKGYSYKDIVTELNISMDCVKSSLHAARKVLQEMGCQPV